MPSANLLSERLKSARFKALFVVLVMLLNVSFSTLSSVSAYAATAEEVAATEVVEEEPTEETTTEETESEESVEESTESDESEPVVEEEEVPESNNDESTPEVQAAVVSVLDEEADLTASFDCYTRLGLMDYEFSIEFSTSEDQEWMAGGTYNYADPSDYDTILPESFMAADSGVTVSGWDGGTFTWTLNDSEIEVSTENDRCDSPTIGDLVVDVETVSTLETVVKALIESESVCADQLMGLFNPETGPFTVFAPQNSAFASLVAAPGTTAEELNQLLGNTDELCALIGSHVVLGEIVSTDATEEGVTVPTVENDVDGLFIQLVDGQVLVDGVPVVAADNFAANGVVHIVESVLLPQSVGSINPVVTDKTSPALSGSIDLSTLASEEYPQLCVVVRIDGVPYIADVDGMTWSIEEGIVSVNPTKSDTLFDVVVRSAFSYYDVDSQIVAPSVMSCEEFAEEMQVSRADVAAQNLDVVTHGGQLFGLTMSRNVLSFLQPEEPEEPGEVLGETTPEVVVEEVAVVATPSCGKGVCDGSVAQATDPNTTDSDGDGVVDALDPDPNDPNVTGLEDVSSDEPTEETEEPEDEDDTNVLLWFLAGGGVVAIWYLLWQRSGRES